MRQCYTVDDEREFRKNKFKLLPRPEKKGRKKKPTEGYLGIILLLLDPVVKEQAEKAVDPLANETPEAREARELAEAAAEEAAEIASANAALARQPDKEVAPLMAMLKNGREEDKLQAAGRVADLMNESAASAAAAMALGATKIFVELLKATAGEQAQLKRAGAMGVRGIARHGMSEGAMKVDPASGETDFYVPDTDEAYDDGVAGRYALSTEGVTDPLLEVWCSGGDLVVEE